MSGYNEKEAAVQKLKEKTEKLISAEKSAKLGYWEFGLQKDYFFWSDEVYRIWDRKKGAFQVGLEEIEKTIHPEDLEKFQKHQQMALDGLKDLDFEHPIILPNQEIKWVHEKG